MYEETCREKGIDQEKNSTHNQIYTFPLCFSQLKNFWNVCSVNMGRQFFVLSAIVSLNSVPFHLSPCDKPHPGRKAQIQGFMLKRQFPILSTDTNTLNIGRTQFRFWAVHGGGCSQYEGLQAQQKWEGACRTGWVRFSVVFCLCARIPYSWSCGKGGELWWRGGGREHIRKKQKPKINESLQWTMELS